MRILFSVIYIVMIMVSDINIIYDIMIEMFLVWVNCFLIFLLVFELLMFLSVVLIGLRVKYM